MANEKSISRTRDGGTAVLEPPPGAPAGTPGKRGGARQPDDSIRLTNSLINAYIADLSRRGSTRMTVTAYRQALCGFQDYLKPEQKIRSGTLREWRDSLRQRGYAAATINMRVSTVNSLLDYCGRKNWTLGLELTAPAAAVEGLTRAEYVRLLQAAKQMNEERSYLLTKLCCTMGLTTVELQELTVETVHAGQLTAAVSAGSRQERVAVIPESLRAELLAFAKRQGIRKGPIFRGSGGKPLARSVMLVEIKKICPAAQVPKKKCTIRALRRLYQTTYSDIQEKYTRMIDRSTRTC